MLTELLIWDFAIVDHLHLQWSSGLNVLTGETGAGKSVVVDALGFVLGERASASLVRAGCKGARVEAVFMPSGHASATLENGEGSLHEKLLAWGVSVEDGALVLARELTAGGRNTYRINGTMVTLGNLREAAHHLVEVHGQHDSQGLLATSRHLELLDRLGGETLAAHRLRWREVYARWQALRAEQARLLSDQRDRERRREWLAHEVAEIEQARPGVEPDELDQLRVERTALANVDKIRVRLAEASSLLDEGEGDGVRILLGRVARLLGQVATLDAGATRLDGLAAQASLAIDELYHEVVAHAEGLDADPRRLEKVNERIDVLTRLQRKYGQTMAEVVAHAHRAQVQLLELESSEQRLQEVAIDIRAAAQQLASHGLALSQARREVARGLEQRVADELALLEMKGTRFAARFRVEADSEGLEVQLPADWLGEGQERVESPAWSVGPQGLDRFEFLIAPNLGQALQSLAQIASGGEMARVMLALQVVLCDIEPVDTLIFDEIDAGLGGVAAEAVAGRLQAIAQARQVLCITHQPIVAAAADTHWSLHKEPVEGVTRTRAHRLDAQQRALELARMMAGTRATDTTMAQAFELLKRSTVKVSV